MTSDRENEIERICQAALEREGSARAAFLAEACAGDASLQRDVESLLAQESAAAGFMSTPAAAFVSGTMGDGTSFIGRQLGPYVIHSRLGAGGMGEVYRAHDTKLGRDVAIKILPRIFTSDPDRLARFEREARLLASLNHPNIGAIYGLEDVDGVPSLVLELVEGETLADRLTAGPLPIPDALKIAGQIADALEAAHERGIVHRDLKPANIVLHDLAVKVLDFGLAKAMAGDLSGPDLSKSLTITDGDSKEGVMLGTAAYMSPGQARGRPVDKRADVWAFGCVLYEMLTGRLAFPGDTLSDTIVSILQGEPDWQALPETTPSAIRRLLRRCLEKDPARRLRDIGDARLDIDEAFVAPQLASTGAAAAGRGSSWAGTLAAVMTAVVLLMGLSIYRRAETPVDVRVIRTTILPPEHTAFDMPSATCPVAVSPDGSLVTFCVRSAENSYQLWLHSLDAVAARPLPGTEGARFPFWSADSRWIGFFAGGKLMKIPALGGPAQILADAPQGTGGTWNRDGVIVFAPESAAPLRRVSAAGGPSSPATTLDASRRPQWPWFLPDGKHFLYSDDPGPVVGPRLVNIRVASLDPGAPMDAMVVAQASSNAVYAQGYVLFLSDTTLMAEPFDAMRLVTMGDAVPVAEHVRGTLGEARGIFSVSGRGLLAYQAGGDAPIESLAWFHRNGRQGATIGDPSAFGALHLSPDRRHAAVSITDPMSRTAAIWIYDLANGGRTRFTYDAAWECCPIWSPKGDMLVFESVSHGTADLFRKPFNGAGAEELLYADRLVPDKEPLSWSADGRFLLYNATTTANTRSDLWILPDPAGPPGARKPFPFVQTPSSERNGQFSPDGQWIAYNSNSGVRAEIYIAPFRERESRPGEQRQISTAGGILPRWRPDGKELFYIAPDSRLMSVEVTLAGETPKVGAPRPLFAPLVVGRGFLYDVSADGQQFLAVVPQQSNPFGPVTLVQNWTVGLRR